MVALAERLRLELDSSDRKNLVGSQIIPDKSRNRRSGYQYCLLSITREVRQRQPVSRMRNSHSSPNQGCIRMRYAKGQAY